MSTATQASPTGSDLCTECGLCCDGTWFEYVPITEEQIGVANSVGLEVTNDANGLNFKLPCHNLCDCKCMVYQRRPQVCSDFQCHLLRSLLQGRLTLEECLKPVRRARQLVQKIKAENRSGKPFRIRLREIVRDTTGAERVEAIKANKDWVLMNLALLSLYTQHFEAPKPRSGDTGESPRKATSG